MAVDERLSMSPHHRRRVVFFCFLLDGEAKGFRNAIVDCCTKATHYIMCRFFFCTTCPAEEARQRVGQPGTGREREVTDYRQRIPLNIEHVQTFSFAMRHDAAAANADVLFMALF